MKKLVLASNNKHKVSEIKAIFNDYKILTMNDIEYYDEIVEDGNTFVENSLIKAKTISEYLHNKGIDCDVLADDSGLCCEALDGAPGIYSARYAGGHGNDKANRDKLIEELKDKDKKAYFICSLVLYKPDNTYISVEGRTYGTIVDEEKGDTSFGYDCIFLSDDLGVTFGEASSEEKNKVSHRYRALVKLKEKIEE